MAILVASLCSFAQKTPKRNAEERAEMYARSLNKELGLTADQSAKIRVIQFEHIKNIDEIREKGVENADKKAMRQEIKTANDATQTQIKALMTNEQKTKFDAWQAQKREEIKNRQGGRDNE